MSDVVSLHEAEYGEKPDVVTSAPGVVNLMGAHTESTDGYLLLFGMNRRAYVAASLRKDSSIRFYAADLNERKRTSTSALKYRQEDRFAGITKGTVSRLQTIGAHIRGVNVTITSGIPSGIGLGCSQAIGVALTTALAGQFGLDIEPIEGAQIAHYVEHSYEGLAVGLAEFIASAVAKRDTFLFIDTHRLAWTHIPADLSGASLVGLNTHAPSALTPAEEAVRQAECLNCLQIIAGHRNGCSFQDYTLGEMASSIDELPGAARRYCKHIVTENERVLRCRSAIAGRDIDQLGKQLTESHESLRDLYEGTTPEVDWLVKHALTVPGVTGARLAGGSTGTCVLILGQSEISARLGDLIHEYEHIFGFHPSIFTLAPEDGVRIDFGGVREGTADQRRRY